MAGVLGRTEMRRATQRSVHYRLRAEEIRTGAEQLTDKACREVMLSVADGYIRLADAAEQLAGSQTTLDRLQISN